jgi:hypothetical protein
MGPKSKWTTRGALRAASDKKLLWTRKNKTPLVRQRGDKEMIEFADTGTYVNTGKHDKHPD